MAASSPDPVTGAYLLLERLRWGGAPDRCPQCGVTGRCYFLTPADGASRATRTGARSERRVWKCGACRRQFSALTGTVLEGTRIALPTWLQVVALLAADDLSSAQIGAATGLGRDAARHVIARWNAAAECEPLRTELSRNR